MYAIQQQQESTGYSLIQNSKVICRESWDAVRNHPGTKICLLALWILRVWFELSWMFVCAVLFAMPIMFIIQVVSLGIWILKICFKA